MAANAPKSEVVQARLEKDVKEQGNRILQDLGLDASTAINMFYHQIILQGGLPFSVKLSEKVDDEIRRRIIKVEAREFGLIPDDSEEITSGDDLNKYWG